MPGILGTGTLAAQLVMAAKQSVQEKWLKLNRELSAEEIAQMVQEMEAAGYDALFAHFASNAVVAGTATGALAGGPGVPVVGTIV